MEINVALVQRDVGGVANDDPPNRVRIEGVLEKLVEQFDCGLRHAAALGASMKHHLRRCHQHLCFSVLLRVMSDTVSEPITLGGLGTVGEPRARQHR